ncbi:MAG TPA: hypothetical protein VLV50_04415 [Stellaceae bacterium]|nr:hypothetical protein [Stellaceae bacterium]
MRNAVIASALALGLGACASITGSSSQPVSITTADKTGPIQGANCNLTNSKGTWYVQTPGSVTIHKAFGDLAIDCKKDQEAGSAVFSSSADAGTYGNIVFGGLVGFAIDAGGGAGFSYPQMMNIMLVEGAQVPTVPPLPNAPAPQANAPAPGAPGS